MRVEIKTLELHVSNKCTGTCKICCKCFSPNKFKPAFATPEYFRRVIECLKDVDCHELQTSGYGDAFLNPIYLDGLRAIRNAYPSQRIVLYTSAFSLTPERTDRIIRERLLDEINVRVDTTNPQVYAWHTGMNLGQILANMEYFRKHNELIDLTIIYFPLHLYALTCRRILGKEPAFFHEAEVAGLLRDEEKEVYAMIEAMPGPLRIRTRRSGICLWAERYDAPFDHSVPCRQLDDAFNWQMLIYPNMDCGLCPYDSGQDTLIYGNIFRESIASAWNGDARKRMIDRVRSNEIKDFPCNNRKCCSFYDV